MNMPKWSKITILGTLMGTCFTAGVYAQDLIQRVDAYLRNDFNVVVDGKQVKLENPPLIYNNASYLPVKELGSYLGAIVNWKESNKTIYINSRIHPEQPSEGNGTNYTEIVLLSPYAQYMEYLGGTYPVLLNMTSDETYYRLKDIQRMGVDTQGLHQAKEKYTGDLYVGEKELKNKWKANPPQFSYMTDEPYVITGETDPSKRKALNEYVKSYLSYKVNNDYFSDSPIIIDAKSEENTYEYLFSENGHFYRTTLKLTKMLEFTNSANYIVGSSTKEDIQVTLIK
jgi:hypothetical protein